jgi:hypothetical protein
LMKGDRWNQSSCGPSHCPDVIRPTGVAAYRRGSSRA